jgi:hypothetical protein
LFFYSLHCTGSERRLIWIQKLQRAIAESRGKSLDIPLSTALQSTVISEGPNRSGDESAPEGKGKQREKPTAGATATGITTKRKYRRHPKVSLIHSIPANTAVQYLKTLTSFSPMSMHLNVRLRPMSSFQTVRPAATRHHFC